MNEICNGSRFIQAYTLKRRRKCVVSEEACLQVLYGSSCRNVIYWVPEQIQISLTRLDEIMLVGLYQQHSNTNMTITKRSD